MTKDNLELPSGVEGNLGSGGDDDDEEEVGIAT